MKTIQNHVQLVGIVGEEPVIDTLYDERKRAQFFISYTETLPPSESGGKPNKMKHSFKCVAYEGLATIIEKYVSKGKQIAISGKLRSNKPEGSDRENIRIICEDILLLGKGR